MKWIERSLAAREELGLIPASSKFVSLVPKEVGCNQTFFNWAIPGLFFFIFVFSGLQLTDNYIQRCHCGVGI